MGTFCCSHGVGRAHLEPEALPWDTATGLDGSMVVVRPDGVGLDGHPKGKPERGEGADAGVAGGTAVEHLAAGHLTEFGAEHVDWSEEGGAG